MDNSFIKRATSVTSFNLTAKDFESTRYKKEIQYIFKLYFFPNFDLSRTSKSLDVLKFNSNVQRLKSENFDLFTKMHSYNLNGIGPGEVSLFFLIDDAYLGGGSSAGVDLFVGSKKYEVKAVDVMSTGYLTNFKLGGSFDLSDITSDLMALKSKVNGTGEGVNKASLDLIKRKYPQDFRYVEDKFIDRAYENYFRNHEIIFIQNTTRKIGDIVGVKKVRRQDIFIDRVTSGVIKPMIRL